MAATPLLRPTSDTAARGAPSSGTVAAPLTARRAVAMHLLPGVPVAVMFYLLAPGATAAGYPAIAAGIVAAAVAVVGGQLGWLLHQAHQRTGRWSLSAVLPYRPGPWTWRRTLLTIGLLIWAFFASMVMGGFKPAIVDAVFPWMPAWAINPLPTDVAATASGAALAITGAGFLLFLVILGPLAEELYFRGHLLPRLTRFGAWAPLLNIFLFALYHLWKPWDLLAVTVTLLPMGYAVWRTRDVRIGIAVHVGINGLGFLLNVLPRLLAA